jgi:hypothetical protein
MASVDAALAELDSIINEVQTSPRLKGDDRVKLVIEIRSRIIAQIVLLNSAIAGDSRLQASPDLTKDFAERLTALRLGMAGLQAKWRAADLTERFEVYAVESRPVAESIADFVKWAKQARAT